MPRTPRTPKRKKYIGAHCLRVWRDEADDEDSATEVYISFGEYDEDNGVDTYGVPDDDIFFYAKNEAQLRKLCSKSEKVNTEDWYLLEYSLVEDD